MKLTPVQSTINRFNRTKAWKVFYPEGNGKAKQGFDLHHIEPKWRHEDIERYISWNIEDLIMIPHDEHARIHQCNNDMKSCRTPEAIERMRQSKLGNNCAKGPHNVSEENRKKMGHWKGQKFKAETCAKMSDSRKGNKNPAFGRHWWNNGKVQIFCKEQPEGFVKGTLKNK